ncbi:MAG: 3'(2'),5'-bisphosphate nucleotidase CysQ, partial [Phaeodactylibacter sp.]|nr:3'(2'),5'-bisphosphate nucleotidase CysQ [Phaeodactylibacter sp.]
MDLRKLAHSVCAIAEAAGQVILEVYEASEGVVIEKKADDSPLTIADRKANKIICDRLEQLDPIFPIVSEENKEIPYETRKNFDYNWLVDPLDGTKEFIKRNGEFT